ncbi:energy transducer TonB [uncultured Sunxiuqinia sp.]|jgi:TonB-like protein|uniref:energy transducer TonB n=1 Tax=uncultured Sunxiuqinia sp. TaxID=1573825 RepID=UPI0030D9728E|tara:strand:+ start:20229 stop:20933 length:705 start_codon:yes stop_codon:yes gene_type:complete
MNWKRKLSRIYTTLIASFILVAGAFTATAQNDDMKYDELEKMQDHMEGYLFEVYELVGDYPSFGYEYVYHDGHLDRVMVSGIDDPATKKEVAELMHKFRSAKDDMKNYCTRVGIYYAPEQEAEPKMGYESFREEVRENLNYPERAENFGVEGTVYVKFIVEKDGEVSFVTADHAIDSPYEQRVDRLEEVAITAVEDVDAEWEPAIVDGAIVDSWAVIPVTFDFQKNPALPALIR